MSIYYAICDALPFEMLHWDFMKNAFLAVLIMTPLFGLISTMIVTGKMSFFSDALGHSAFTGIAIGAICGIATPNFAAVIFSVLFALLFSFVRSRSTHTAEMMSDAETLLFISVKIAGRSCASTCLQMWINSEAEASRPDSSSIAALILMF